MKSIEEIDEEFRQDLLLSNPTWRYIVYGGIYTFSKNPNCKMIKKGIELGYEVWDCYVGDIFVFTFKNYVGFGFSSQPHYFDMNYVMYDHLKSNGIFAEVSSYKS